MSNNIAFYGIPSFGAEFVRQQWAARAIDIRFIEPGSTIGSCRVLAYFGGTEVNAADTSQLNFIQLLTAGHDYIDLPAMAAKGIMVASHGHANAVAVAEHTIMLMLGLLRRQGDQMKSLQAGHWRQGTPVWPIRELRGRRVGILGLGHIGSRVAELASAFGAEVVYHDIAPKQSRYQALPFPELVRKAEILSIHVPLTDQTRNMITGDVIAAMPEGSYLINTARGGIVDEAAARKALRSGRLAGLALDVFAIEPPELVPYQECGNLLLTPHRAGASRENWFERLTIAMTNIDAFLAGQDIRYRLV